MVERINEFINSDVHNAEGAKNTCKKIELWVASVISWGKFHLAKGEIWPLEVTSTSTNECICCKREVGVPTSVPTSSMFKFPEWVLLF